MSVFGDMFELLNVYSVNTWILIKWFFYSILKLVNESIPEAIISYLSPKVDINQKYESRLIFLIIPIIS
jgi:hypothetical protein